MKKSLLFITCLAVASASPLFGNQLSLGEKWDIDTEIIGKQERMRAYRAWRTDMQYLTNHQVAQDTGFKNLVDLLVSFPDKKLDALYFSILGTKGITSEQALFKTLHQSTLEWVELVSKALEKEIYAAVERYSIKKK